MIGGVVAAGVLFLIASGKAGVRRKRWIRVQRVRRAFARGLCARRRLVAEIVLTFMFLMIILGATDRRAPQGFAPIAIGFGADADPPDRHSGHELCRSTRPAAPVRRSSSAAGRLEQLWLFWLAPIIGAALGGVVYSALARESPEPAREKSLAAVRS